MEKHTQSESAGTEEVDFTDKEVSDFETLSKTEQETESLSAIAMREQMERLKKEDRKSHMHCMGFVR